MRLFRRSFTRPGAPPGALAVSEEHVEPAVDLFLYGPDDLVEDHGIEVVERVREHADDSRVAWVNVSGLGDGTVVQRIGAALDLHPLALSDVVNVGQRPKADDYGEILFFVVRMVTPAEDGIAWEQVSMFLGPGWVITFQERPGDCLDGLRERIRAGRRNIRSGGADYLAVMVLDAVVDGYFPVLQALADDMEGVEDAILERPSQENLEEVYRLRRQLTVFRRAVWPARDVLTRFVREEKQALDANSVTYLRDVTDHVMQVVDVVESFRETASSLVEVHISSMGQRTNEVMRVLTVIATIFIPLTFVAGVYGMNFDTSRPGNMPELSFPYGYVGFWAFCLTAGVVLLLVFRRLGWLGGGGRG